MTDPKNPVILAYIYDQKLGYSLNDFNIINYLGNLDFIQKSDLGTSEFDLISNITIFDVRDVTRPKF